jgi:UDP-GlcNAc:undecaprenyl-phosphate GlcNAc-1-phosphate transferase
MHILNHITINNIIILSVLAFSSFFISWIALRGFLSTGLTKYFIDKPDHRKVHSNPIPRLGGIVIVLSFLINFLVWNIFSSYTCFPRIQPNILAVTLISAVILGVFGFLDDSIFKKIRVRHKITAEILLASVAVYFLDINTGSLSIFGLFTIPLWASQLVSILWIIGIINAVNIIDGIDGMAGIITVIAFATLAYIAAVTNHPRIAILCGILIFSTAGFLVYNISPAKVFMGDTGSMFLGAMLGIITLHLAKTEVGDRSVLVMPLILGAPFCEVFVTVTRRYFSGLEKKLSVSRILSYLVAADNSHIHHRMIFRGLSHSQITTVMAIMASMFSVGAICILLAPSNIVPFITAYLALPVVIMLYRLGFGGRFLKALRLSKSRYNGYHKMGLVGVVDESGTFTKLLNHREKEGMVFVSLPKSEPSTIPDNFHSVIINKPNSSNDPEELKKAEMISYNLCAPVFIISPEKNYMFNVKNVHRNGKLTLKEKIVSIDQFIKEVRIVTQNGKQKHAKTSPVPTEKKA